MLEYKAIETVDEIKEVAEFGLTGHRLVAQRPRRKTGPTIRDVAEECGVSAMTVSAVLNNRHSKVSVETRERVLTCIRKLDYQPSAAARALSRKRTDTIGIVFGIIGAATAMANPYASGILEGILRETAKSRLDVHLVNRHWYSTEESIGAFKDERTDGILLLAPSRDSDIVEGLASLRRPLVTISGDAAQYGIPSVDTDDTSVGRVVVDHLMGLGHRRIAHITGNHDMTSTHRRAESFRAAMDAHSLRVLPDFILGAAYSGEGATEAVAKLMSLPQIPTAIFCGNDNLAFAVIRALNEQGYSVPRDVSVVGVDDVDAAARVTPPLTTVRQSLVQIGALATGLLVAAIDNQPVAAIDHLIPPQLIVRQSTAVARP